MNEMAQNRIEYGVEPLRNGTVACRPLKHWPIVPRYFLTFLSTAVIKTWIGLGKVFLITPGFSWH